MRLRNTAATAAPAAQRPHRGSQGQATRASEVITAMWPETNPSPWGAAPRTTTSSSTSLGRPRSTNRFTTLAST